MFFLPTLHSCDAGLSHPKHLALFFSSRERKWSAQPPNWMTVSVALHSSSEEQTTGGWCRICLGISQSVSIRWHTYFFFIDCSAAKHVVPGSPYHRSMERLHCCKQRELPATYKPQHRFTHRGAFLKRKPLNSGKSQLNMLQRAIFYLSHYNWWLVLLNCDCKHLPVEAPSEMLVSFHRLHCSRYSSAPFAADLTFGRTHVHNCSWFIQVFDTVYNF